jgi:uncharacterized Fe-S cluster protein YjdI
LWRIIGKRHFLKTTIMESNSQKRYTNNEVTIVWQPDVCIHAGICVRGLPEVFNAKAKPWINIDGASTEQLINQVKKCPSGALSYFMNTEQQGVVTVDAETIVEVTQDGPILVYGNVCIKDAAGIETKRNKVTAFCRCGASNNKPYCDGMHRKIGFKG